jgi:hypothetical protein
VIAGEAGACAGSGVKRCEAHAHVTHTAHSKHCTPPAAHPEGALLPEQGEAGAFADTAVGAGTGRLICVNSTARGPAVSVARPRRVPRPRATCPRPVDP